MTRMTPAQQRRNLLFAASATGASLLLGGCIGRVQSTALNADRVRSGIRIERSMPANLPSNTHVLPGEQMVLVPTETAAGLLVPIPFLAEAVVSVIDRSEANAASKRLTSVDPFVLARDAWQGSPLLGASPDALRLQPFAFLQACADDRYRVALVYQLSDRDWVARYTEHLPTAYPSDDFHRVTPQVLQTLQRELGEAAAVLRRLVERGARGELGPGGTRVDVGSLHLVGGRTGGWMPPTLIVARNAELIEEDEVYVLVRLDGNPSMAASAGGLYFGVHRLRKDQLHTFRRRGAG